MRFWDASALVPLCVNEPLTSRVRALIDEDPALVAWWGTPIECFSAFARLRRAAVLTRRDEEQARHVLLRLASNWTEVEPGNQVRDHAIRALLLHPLRAPDSLQLAAAQVWTRSQPTDHHFVCLDERLRDAAQREGFAVLPTN